MKGKRTDLIHPDQYSGHTYKGIWDLNLDPVTGDAPKKKVLVRVIFTID